MQDRKIRFSQTLPERRPWWTVSKNVTLGSFGVLFISYPIILPNRLPLSCLFYADDLVKAKYPQYCNKWLLKMNRKITKVLIFQKQNRKSTRDKYTFFLNGNQIASVTEYSYLDITFN